MARFIIIHTGKENVSQDEVVEAAKKVRCSLPADLKWLNSWFIPTGYRLICEWEGGSEAAVRAAVELVADLWPIEVIHEVVHVDPDWYK